MSTTWSFRALPPEMQMEARERSEIVRHTLRKLRIDLMPRASPMDIDVWEREYGDKVVELIARAQAKNAALVDKTMNLELMANGWQDTPIGLLNPDAFAGFMPDGDPLEIIPRAVAKRVRERLALYEDPTPQQRRLAWEAGGQLLATITQTALIDTQRMAKSVAGLMRPKTLYVRVANVPCCARCAVLAGKRGYWDEAFRRHPGCDCTQIAVPDDDSIRFDGPGFDVQAYWDSLSAADQDKVFTKSGAAAIRAGADINQVVNSRLGMSAAGSSFTTSRSKTMRYYYGRPTGSLKGLPRVQRLSVPEIIKLTEGDQQRRVELLYRYGYIRSVKPGVLPAKVRDAVADTARARHQALFEEFSEIVPKIDPTLPVEHITKYTAPKLTKAKRIVLRGGHTHDCALRSSEDIALLRNANPDVMLQERKTFFPKQDDDELAEWLIGLQKEAFADPDQLSRTVATGWRIQKASTDPGGRRILVEYALGPTKKGSDHALKINSVYPRNGDSVLSIEVNGQQSSAPWKGGQ
ncbi:hypothetical protein AK829_06490 [Corynebacterium riegelii]|uniref:Uncharacterized protein n=1 Tax=Corynebacterium riegelii TaxID=156976 RepID=A0A0K1RCF9_9CORY|nr:hypothetical protein AK829_06490 [Corynebacterium riegelii]